MCKKCIDELTKNDIVYSTNLVAQATAQFSLENFAVIENNVYFVTVHVASIKDIANVTDLIQLKIRKAFSFKDEKLEDRIGMIISGDVRGSRNGYIDYSADQSPHIHALIFLSPGIVKEFENDNESISKRIKNEILEIREVNKAAKKLDKTTQSYKSIVDVRQYDSSERCFFYTVDYLIKANKKFADKYGVSLSETVFPFEAKSRSRRAFKNLEKYQSSINKRAIALHVGREKLFKNKNNKKMCSFQEEMRAGFRKAFASNEALIYYNRLVRQYC